MCDETEKGGQAPRQPERADGGDLLRARSDRVDTAGVRLVPIRTPSGTFRVWTKRFGAHPTIKLLLLHGGPGATHEYFEALERFLGAEGIEFIYYDQLGSANSISRRTTRCGRRNASSTRWSRCARPLA